MLFSYIIQNGNSTDRRVSLQCLSMLHLRLNTVQMRLASDLN